MRTLLLFLLLLAAGCGGRLPDTDTTRPIEAGDIVRLKGDSAPVTYWTVEKVEGDQVHVVHTVQSKQEWGTQVQVIRDTFPAQTLQRCK